MSVKKAFTDTARFTSSDPEPLVAASLACGACLKRPVTVLLVEGDDVAVAISWCEVCGVATEVTLNPEQLLRIAMKPPGSMLIQTVN